MHSQLASRLSYVGLPACRTLSDWTTPRLLIDSGFNGYASVQTWSCLTSSHSPLSSQEHLSSKGLRVLAVCRGEVPHDEDLSDLNPDALLKREPSLAFVALLAILDPPREEVIEAVKVAHTAGICVKMITGESHTSLTQTLFIHPHFTPSEVIHAMILNAYV